MDGPHPENLGAPSRRGHSETEVGRLSRVADRLRDIGERFSGRYCLYAEHLDTGETITYGTFTPMETASCIKLPILVEVFRQIEAGHLALTAPVILTEDDQVTGSGVMQHLSPGVSYPLKDVLTLMIIISDNTATNMALRTVGLSQVNSTMKSLGLSDTRIFKRIDWTIPGPIGHSTPKDLAQLLKAIHRDELLSPTASRAMWDILERQQFNTLHVRQLPYDLLTSEEDDVPPRVTVGSKSGSVKGVRNDAGLVLTPWGAYVLSIMSEGCEDLRFHPDNEAMVLLPEASRAVFDHFTREAAEPVAG